MKKKLGELTEITRGMALPPNERVKPKDMSNIEELFVLGYTDLLSLNEVPDLSNTINITSVEKDDKVYVNLSQKVKKGTIQKKDIILPISNIDFEPRFVMWNQKETLNYIYHQKLIVIRVISDKILPEYLFFKLDNKKVKEFWREHSKEGKRFRLVCQTVMDYEIDLPSIEEQTRIVEMTMKHNLETIKIRSLYD